MTLIYELRNSDVTTGVYTKSGIGGVQVTSLHRDPIGVDNRSLEAKN